MWQFGLTPHWTFPLIGCYGGYFGWYGCFHNLCKLHYGLSHLLTRGVLAWESIYYTVISTRWEREWESIFTYHDRITLGLYGCAANTIHMLARCYSKSGIGVFRRVMVQGEKGNGEVDSLTYADRRTLWLYDCAVKVCYMVASVMASKVLVCGGGLCLWALLLTCLVIAMHFMDCLFILTGKWMGLTMLYTNMHLFMVCNLGYIDVF
jgi:hypothetical protein